MPRLNRSCNRASSSITASRSRRRVGAAVEALEVRLVLSTFIVNTFLDQTDPPLSTTVSLRNAIAAAAAHAGPDTIDVPAGKYPLTQGGLLIDDTSGTVTIHATGGTAVIDAQSKSRVLKVAANTSVSANGLTITGGNQNAVPFDGGGVLNGGTLVLENCAISGNAAEVGGGGINNSGQLTVGHSTISENTGGSAGGIDDTGTLVLTNSTLSGNTSAYFGAIYNTGTAAVSDCTITANDQNYAFPEFPTHSGGLQNGSSGTLTLANSIVAGNTSFAEPVDVGGSIKSLGHNLIGQTDGSSGWIASDLTGTHAHPFDPELSPLGDYGGPTQTLVPLAGSPAIGAGSVALIPAGNTTDQRGFARIVGGKVDIGAVELHDASLITVAPPAVQSVVAGVAASIKLGSFTDPGGKGPFGIDVQWGDGSPDSSYPIGAIGSLGSGSHAFIKTGVLKGTIIVFDGSGDVSRPASFSVSSAAAPAQTFTVNTNGDQTDPAGSKTVTLRDAVSRADASFGPVTIKFDPKVFAAAQTITLGSNLELSNNPAPITLDGPTAGVTATGMTPYEISTSFNIVVDAGVTASLNRINAGIDNSGTLAVSDGVVSGVTTYYGGIENAGTMTLTDSVVSGNTAQQGSGPYLGGFGGGIDNTGKMTVVDCTISGNNAVQGIVTTGGGGIANSGEMTVVDSTISGNNADESDGGIYNSGLMTVVDSTISGNNANVSDGGIYNSGRMTVVDSTISGNNAFVNGGIDNSGQMTVADSTISGNTAEAGDGGGIGNAGQMTVADSTITGNYCDYGSGSGIENAGHIAISDSTITENSTDGSTAGTGGGINNNGTLALANTIVAGNSGGDVFGNVKSLGHNLIGQADRTNSGWLSSDLTGTDANPLDPDLSPLGNYGGPTQTQVPLTGSPAIGAGSVALLPAGDTTDQRGFARVVGGKVDIGAVELQKASVVTVTPPAARAPSPGYPRRSSWGHSQTPPARGRSRSS